MSTTHKSRWGYHPVSYEDFSILQALHRRYWESLSGAYRWQRWYNKTVHRYGAEPTVDSLITRRKPTAFSTITQSGFLRTHLIDFQPSLRPRMGDPRHTFSDERQGSPPVLDIVEDYRNARTPKTSPDAVIELPEGVMARYREIYASLITLV